MEKFYDLSSEENLLRNLPAKYESTISANEGMEMQSGLMVCVTRLFLGDFDFAINYRSNDYRTFRPKRLKELDILISALPNLKKKYLETGSVD